MRDVRDLLRANEFHIAGTSAADRLESSALLREIERKYLEAGFESVEGLLVDGQKPDAELLWSKGPEGLTKEISERIREAWHLSENSRKN